MVKKKRDNKQRPSVVAENKNINKNKNEKSSSSISFILLTSGVTIFISLLLFWWFSRPIVLHNVQVFPVSDLLNTIKATSYKADGSNQMKISENIFVGKDLSTRVTGMFATNGMKKGESIVFLPTSSIISSYDVFPSSWLKEILALRLKGYPKQKSVLNHHKLALGMLGCFLKSVNGDKVSLAHEYYRFNSKLEEDSIISKSDPRKSYSYWHPKYKKFLDSIPQYSRLNKPPYAGSWRVFNSYYRTQFPGVSTKIAKYLYFLITSKAFNIFDHSQLSILPLLDNANPSLYPNANLTCTNDGCELVLIKDVQAGEEITQHYEDGSHLYLLQKYGVVKGDHSKIITGSRRKNVVANGIDFAKCTIHFESLKLYPETGGINPNEWECLRSKDISASKILKWAYTMRKDYHNNLKLAKVELLMDKKDYLSTKLLEYHMLEMEIFSGEPNNMLFDKEIKNALKREEIESEKKYWSKKAMDAFERL